MTTPDTELLTARDKGLPERAVGMTAAAFLAGRPRLGEFWTPLVVLDDEAMRSNIQVMAGWGRERGPRTSGCDGCWTWHPSRRVLPLPRRPVCSSTVRLGDRLVIWAEAGCPMRWPVPAS